MVISGIIADGKKVWTSIFDTSVAVEDNFSSASKISKKIPENVENTPVVVDRVPPEFVCKGRCDACMYRNVVHSGQTR